MPLVRTTGLVTYNGYVFSAYLETLGISVTPVEDEAKRTVIYNVYKFSLRDYIAGRNIDYAVSRARILLTKNGCPFTYINKGVGAFNVNIGSARDVAWGPKVTNFTIKPKGDKSAHEIRWDVEVAVPDCPAANFAFAPMEFNFRLEFGINKNGYTTRTYSGFIRVPATGGGFRELPDTADNYRELISPTALPGFRRIPGTFTLDYAKTRLDFSIVDQEFAGPAPPPGITDVECTHSVQSTEAGLIRWIGNFNGTYTVAKGYDKGLAINHFNKLATLRIKETGKSLGLNPDIFLLLSYKLSEPLYAEETGSFSLSYAFTPCQISQILNASQMWQPVPDSDWKQWQTSMNGVLTPRGVSKLRFTIGEDRLVDLCGPVPQMPVARPETKENTLTSFGDLGLPLKPKPVDSWLQYKSSIRVEGDDGVVAIPTLPKVVPSPITGPILRSGPRSPIPEINLANPTGGRAWTNIFEEQLSTELNRKETEVQQRTFPAVVIYLIGEAYRLAYPIPQPRLLAVDDQYAVPANRQDKNEGFQSGVTANFGQPIFHACWNLRYVLRTSFLGELLLPENRPINPLPVRRGGSALVNY